MALTLGALRTYALETASSDPSGTTSSREVQKWINQAFQRIWRHPWRWALRNGRVMIPPTESGVALVATQASRQVTLGGTEAFKAKYLDENWALHSTSQGRILFRLGAIHAPQAAEFKTGHEWVSDSGTVSYFWARDQYPLPEDAKKLMRVADALSYYELEYKVPHLFDFLRQSTPSTQSPNPVYYTVRQGRVEIWPIPGDSYRVLEFAYQTKPPTYKVTDDNTTVVDWQEEWSDMLEAAIVLQAAISQGEEAPVPYGIALREYEERYMAYKGEDSETAKLTGPMSPTVPGERRSSWYEGVYPNTDSMPNG